MRSVSGAAESLTVGRSHPWAIQQHKVSFSYWTERILSIVGDGWGHPARSSLCYRKYKRNKCLKAVSLQGHIENLQFSNCFREKDTKQMLIQVISFPPPTTTPTPTLGIFFLTFHYQ